MTAQQRMATGGYGEERAAKYLSGLGMVVLDRNWRCDLGELDLVLRDGRVLVFCEVKTRASAAFGGPLEAVTPAKLARLRRLAARWLADHDVRPPEVRLDVVGVQLDRGGDKGVQHVRGVG
ncbi:YraN family protein [Nocardioides caldifontis]|uniref:YraN family protein n=1 Tax=Nocardioides caldifontis TaxID=2588938 RepID=UPI0023B0DF20|nr:YraN family protein [Nocardioides caldifontis]